jgi:hypothetical protein
MEGFKCVDCAKLPPDAESAYTLIGGKSGWRLTRHRDAAGAVIPEWRCPECWAVFRKKTMPPGKMSTAALAGPKRGFGRD